MSCRKMDSNEEDIRLLTEWVLTMQPPLSLSPIFHIPCMHHKGRRFSHLQHVFSTLLINGFQDLIVRLPILKGFPHTRIRLPTLKNSCTKESGYLHLKASCTQGSEYLHLKASCTQGSEYLHYLCKASWTLGADYLLQYFFYKASCT